MTDLCNLKGCDQPALPPTFIRNEERRPWTGRSGTSKGGLGLCATHDRETTELVRHRRQVGRLHNAEREPWLLYFARCISGKYEGFIKIGTSTSPDQRMIHLRSECQGRAELLHVESGSRPEEGQLAIRFWDLWVIGEWYRPGPELMAYIEERRAA